MNTKNYPEKINGKFKNKDILSLDQFSKKDIKILFTATDKIKRIINKPKLSTLLQGKIVTLLFYEPSSRTFGSFSSAVKRLGGQTISIQDPQRNASVAKGETLEDTIRVFEAYSDTIIIRHPLHGQAKAAADAAFFIPIINAGDGIGEHPTQALCDLYTIYKKFKTMDNLTLLIAGDLVNARTVHSLLKGLSLFKKNTAYLLAPEKLRLTRDDFSTFTKRGLKLIEIEKYKDLPKNANVWYWTRIQKERFKKPEIYERLKNHFIVTPQLISEYGNKNMILMHPLPRIGEITTDMDIDPRTVYLKSQVKNGMYVRMALLALVLGKD